jgi:cytochrome c
MSGARLFALFLLMAAGTTGCALRAPVRREAQPRFQALVFSKTAGFRHASIANAVTAIRQLAAEHDFSVYATEDASVFTGENLHNYRVVIFALTTGDVLDESQQAAFERYIRAGGGYVGIHSASDTEYEWPWYGGLVGAYFAGHGAVEPGTVTVADRVHPATAGLPEKWVRTDEWYRFKANPRETVHVLATLDETTTQTSSGMGADHPIAWCQEYNGGRSFYTAGGHTPESYDEPGFLAHLLKGIQTAAGVLPANCRASQSHSFEKVTLDSTTRAPMDLAVGADGRVIYVERHGAIRIVQPGGQVLTAGTLDVHTKHEFGLLGVALDPKFARNHRLYLYYSPAGPRAVDRVSRFTLNGDTLKPGSEMVLLEIDVQREECCHAGGALLFDAKGNLFIATGDNTNPFASDGYTPIDERPGRAAFDAQRSSANTNSLSGKLLRVTPKANGTYRIPKGNLFHRRRERTRPEIYAMGFRNPFTIGLDPATNVILVADYGPDAAQADTLRGPDGRVELNIADRPGFYGWPYCVGDNTPYRAYDFATGQSGPAFDCAGGVVNHSPNNTGLTQLPPAIPATLWMGQSPGPAPAIGKSGAPMTSGTYRFAPALTPGRQWPAYWDGSVVLADWNNGRLFAVQLAESGGGGSGWVGVTRMLTGMSFFRPHRLKFGPDGALYLIDWGKSWSGTDSAGVYRIDYAPGKRPEMVAQHAQTVAPPASPASGVYTAAQAAHGEKVFETMCAQCHDPARFTGPAFQQTWRGQPLFALFDRMRTGMPLDKPGSLSPAEYAAILAYMLQLNQYPVGATELPSEQAALSQIRFELRPSTSN